MLGVLRIARRCHCTVRSATVRPPALFKSSHSTAAAESGWEPECAPMMRRISSRSRSPSALRVAFDCSTTDSTGEADSGRARFSAIFTASSRAATRFSSASNLVQRTMLMQFALCDTSASARPTTARLDSISPLSTLERQPSCSKAAAHNRRSGRPKLVASEDYLTKAESNSTVASAEARPLSLGR